MTQTDGIEKAQKWHLDKGVPIVTAVVLLLGFIGQAASVSYFLGGVDTRVATLEIDRLAREKNLERLTIVESKTTNIERDIKDIKEETKEVKRSVTNIERVLTRTTEGP